MTMPVEVSEGQLLLEYEQVTNALLKENLILKADLKAKGAELQDCRARLQVLQREVSTNDGNPVNNSR